MQVRKRSNSRKYKKRDIRKIFPGDFIVLIILNKQCGGQTVEMENPSLIIIPMNRMINYLHKYPVEVVVLCPDVETIKERERYREKTGYSGFTVETLYDTFMQTTPRIGFWLDNSNQTPQQTAETILNARKSV